MSGLPKLKVTRVPVGYPEEEILELEEAEYRLNYNESAILAEGRPIRNHEELLRLAAEDGYKDKEFINVTIIVEFYVGG